MEAQCRLAKFLHRDGTHFLVLGATLRRGCDMADMVWSKLDFSYGARHVTIPELVVCADRSHPELDFTPVRCKCLKCKEQVHICSGGRSIDLSGERTCKFGLALERFTLKCNRSTKNLKFYRLWFYWYISPHLVPLGGQVYIRPSCRSEWPACFLSYTEVAAK